MRLFIAKAVDRGMLSVRTAVIFHRPLVLYECPRILHNETEKSTRPRAIHGAMFTEESFLFSLNWAAISVDRIVRIQAMESIGAQTSSEERDLEVKKQERMIVAFFEDARSCWFHFSLPKKPPG